MKTIKKNVYYCDFCKKHGMSKSHMVTHEKHCTNNPERSCRMCEVMPGSSLKELVDELKPQIFLQEEETGFGIHKTVAFTGNPITLDFIRAQVDNCPACILSVLRQTGLTHWSVDKDFRDNFNYKDEALKYLQDKHEENVTWI